MFLLFLNVFLREAEFGAVVQMKGHFAFDVEDLFCVLL